MSLRPLLTPFLLLWSFISLIFVVLGWLLKLVVGDVHWQAPGWLLSLGAGCSRLWGWVRANPKKGGLYGLLLLAVLGCGGYGVWWYGHLPKPQMTSYEVKAPPLTALEDNKWVVKPLVIEFSESVAPIKEVGKPIKTGISLSPELAGNWTWDGDKRLTFQPTADWPVGAKFKVKFDKKGFFSPQTKLEEYSFEFDTAPFEVTIASADFYQDPVDAGQKKLVATVQFSHPVDTANFEKRVKLDLAMGATFLGLSGDSTRYTITYDKPRLNAYIHSASLAIPRDDTKMTLTLGKGIVSARGGNETENEISTAITIPGRYSLRFDNASMTLVDNERFEPEQVLLFESSMPVADKALNGNVRAWLLPKHHPDQKAEERDDKTPYHWGDAGEVGKQVLSKASALSITQVPGEEENNSLHSYKFKAPVGRFLYLQVNEGVQAFGGYQSGKTQGFVVEVQPYPQALKVLGQGSLLSLTGEKKVGFMARGLDKVNIEIGRLLPNQLHHLVQQQGGNMFTHPNLADYEMDRLVDRYVEDRDLDARDPGKPVYDSIDLTPYLTDKQGGKRGLFLIKLNGTGKAQQPTSEPQEATDESGEGMEGEGESTDEGESGEASDARLILLTDLGVIVKRAVAGSQDVFVQSIQTGLPVAGARVDVMGRNGQPVETQTTDASGHARLPNTSKLLREKIPTMYVVQKEGDMSFLPIGRSDRMLNLSRFDVGGVSNASTADQLSAYLFSDRGIYRPGEQVNIGTIVRTADWRSGLEGVPLQAEVTDPRGATVFRESIKLSQGGFDSFSWSTTETSPTGEYTVGLYLVKNGARDVQIGNVTVKVRDFEPDRMKVTAKLADGPVDGWLAPADVKAQIKAMHLFGAPAAGRRVEGEIGLSPVLPAFAKYRDYAFYDTSLLSEGVQDKLPATTTDDQGEATLPLDLQRFGAATYRLNFLAKVFEAEGGRNVASQTSVLVSSAPYLMGVKTDGDLGYINRGAARSSRWLAVDRKLQSIAATELKLEWVQRKFVSVLTKQDSGTYKYVSRRKDIVRETKPAQVAAGGTEFALPTAEPGDYMLVLRNQEGEVLNRVEYSVVGEANVSRSLDRNAELQLKLNKTDFEPGETIDVSIRAPYVGSGLITIERDKVYHHVWFKTTTTSSVQQIVLPKDFEGNGYINVQFVRDPGSEEIFMSPLSYGVTPFAVSLKNRTEAVRVETPPVVKPGQNLKMKVKSGQASRVVVFAVDEGILQVARYKTPNPLGFFFQKRALEVNTAQILDLILPEFQRLMQAAAPGGDADGAFSKHLNPFNRKRKAPVAYWSGIVDVGPQGTELTWRVPDYFNGKLRVMAVAVTPQTIGVYEGATDVRGDLILTPNVPAMVAPGDEFTVSVGVFNNTRGGTGPITVVLSGGKELAVVGEGRKQVQAAYQKEGVAEFKLRATEALGAGNLQFVATLGDKSAKMTESVSVRPAVPFRTQLAFGRFNGSNATQTLTRELYPEYRKVDATVSVLPLAWSQGLVAYLDSYPYSCTEQLVSKAMPALVFAGRPELGKIAGKDSIKSALRVLGSRQNDQGAFGLWSSSVQVEPFASAYAVHFLIEAKERGTTLPAGMLESANDWLQNLVNSGGEDLGSARLRAYAIYLLTRQGVVTSGMLSGLQQELDARFAPQWTQDLTAAYVAATYQLLKQDKLADKSLKAVPWSDKRKDSGYWVYYDSLVHDAQLLYLMSRHFPERAIKIPTTVLDNMGKAMSSNHFNSLSSAYLMLGLDAYAALAQSQGVKLSMAEIGRDGSEKMLTLPTGSLPKAAISMAAASVKFGREGNLPAYFAVNESGFDRKVATELREGIEIAREYTDLTGKAISKVKVGDEFLVKLSLRATKRDQISQVAVVDLLPGGVEPVIELRKPVEPDAQENASEQTAPTLPIGVPDKSNWVPDFADLRDDRLVLYGQAGKDVGTFVYKVRATNAGVFKTPAPFAEGMYDRSVVARGTVGKLEIIKP
ncbi:MG2 domain-containing protein [Chitinivorax sp. B]|uniref:MG2 domain-containing protein n=1 Tax=Chitinivorax sp. B TaxID=2502235 RepID=UPI0010F4CFDD|nr:MG2 domain-containing protein [Chitinivorax sp. B]